VIFRYNSFSNFILENEDSITLRVHFARIFKILSELHHNLLAAYGGEAHRLAKCTCILPSLAVHVRGTRHWLEEPLNATGRTLSTRAAILVAYWLLPAGRRLKPMRRSQLLANMIHGSNQSTISPAGCCVEADRKFSKQNKSSPYAEW
jgi:hypothetical protein